MTTTYYERIKQFIKKQVLPLLFLVFLFIILTMKLPWSVYAPGGLINVGERLTTKEKDNYYLTYVTFIEGTLPSLLLGTIFPSWDIVANTDITLEGEDLEIANKRDRIYMQEAISNAIYVGYTKALENANVTKEHGYITYLLEESINDFQIGDEILEVDNNSYQGLEALNEYIETKKKGEEIVFKVERDKKEVEVKAQTSEINGEVKLGIVITQVNEYDHHPEITYSSKKSESGASGGLMMSLSIYDALSKDNLASNRKISGTGTISKDGQVGKISGVKYKLAGAVRKKSDVFIVPSENYEEAVKEKEKNNYKIEIIKATTFDQVLEELRKKD